MLCFESVWWTENKKKLMECSLITFSPNKVRIVADHYDMTTVGEEPVFHDCVGCRPRHDTDDAEDPQLDNLPKFLDSIEEVNPYDFHFNAGSSLAKQNTRKILLSYDNTVLVSNSSVL